MSNLTRFKAMKVKPTSGVYDMSPSECMRIGKYLAWLAGEVPMTPELQALISELDAEFLQDGGKTIQEINAELEAELT